MSDGGSLGELRTTSDTAAQVEQSFSRPLRRVPQSQWARHVPDAIFGPIAQAGEICQLGGKIVYMVLRRPTGYWRQVVDEMYRVVRQSWFPLVMSVVAAAVLITTLAVTFLDIVGGADRFGQFFLALNVIEIMPWLNSMVVAGIVGAAVTADLGARKIREELDAMRVLGLDPIRHLVLARVVTAVMMTVLLNFVAVFISNISSAYILQALTGIAPGLYFATLYDNLTVIHVAAGVAQAALFGFIIGVICAYKGLTVQGGPEGVGRAVNQAIVISFAAVWVTSTVYTVTLMGFFPEMHVLR
ncbi:phospholipid/cholesterol/gamma-HCH transport system permease protein [Haloechinothrix alba]|uniref:Phospholipid/cholesterol/gamma-HCH transport system permease protein n=1 Tax=Haloechinothrix alba TaxID=664784 RepID=A0A239A7H1_9PSEU|nr:ABC transporter permease [Haloechinothrix alba]SNR91510.1 phospholipid/cholesterol/gamma-HCH transport system permease protein [Haloechinothrix alba]